MESRQEIDPDKPVVVLFRHDLRLADNRALCEAARTGKPIVAAFVRDDGAPGGRPIGGARRWWLHHSLTALAASLSALGVTLVLRQGEMQSIADSLVEQTGADMVVWNRRYDPHGVDGDSAMKAALAAQGVCCRSFDGFLLHEPWLLKTGAGGPFKVYSPFWRALVGNVEPRQPVPAPRALRAYGGHVTGERLEDWALVPRQPDWATAFPENWAPGERGAHAALDAFLAGPVAGYAGRRDLPGTRSTSRISPHLAHGEITPFQIWAAVGKATSAPADDAGKFLKEVAWREFSWHLLFHNRDLATRNFNPRFDDFAWRADPRGLRLWQDGRTGYPIVDAGMRELWRTGWMHNRVRMVAASFLVKHLLIDWREGERWFWDTLVDADAGNNAASWQWVAGSGADAAPYFRIFNPVLQGEKFDADGAYVRAFVPEIAGLPDNVLHRPWEADRETLSSARVKLGSVYPVAVIDHQMARERALQAYQNARGAE
jgi:deoxyribodipyrimidine photo-lyase